MKKNLKLDREKGGVDLPLINCTEITLTMIVTGMERMAIDLDFNALL
jgi:hypothetical protein